MLDVRNREWTLEANCRGFDPEMFFPHPKDRRGQVEARRICAACPVRDMCAEYAHELGVTHGVWGGEFRNDRNHTSEGQYHRRPCGTAAAARRHFRKGEKLCQPCSIAAAFDQAEKRARRSQ